MFAVPASQPRRICAQIDRQNRINSNGRDDMDFTTLSFDQIAMAAMTVIALREVMIIALPDRIAGPGGWLVNTTTGDHA